MYFEINFYIKIPYLSFLVCREFGNFYRLLLSLNGLFSVLFLSVVILEPNLDDPGFVSPWDPDPSLRAHVPPSGSSSSSEGTVGVRRKCLLGHRRLSRKSF